MLCSDCPKANKCNPVKKFIHRENLSIKNSSNMITKGLYELYDSKLVNDVFNILNRFRNINGYIYLVNHNGTTIYLRSDEIPVDRLSLFQRVDNHYELTL